MRQALFSLLSYSFAPQATTIDVADADVRVTVVVERGWHQRIRIVSAIAAAACQKQDASPAYSGEVLRSGFPSLHFSFPEAPYPPTTTKDG
jgi:hypothetical protein